MTDHDDDALDGLRAAYEAARAEGMGETDATLAALGIKHDDSPEMCVRTCRRRWLRIKLHFMVHRDEAGLRDLNVMLDKVAGRRIAASRINTAAMDFLDDGDDPITDALMAKLLVYMIVPFWSWRRLHRLNRQFDQLQQYL